MTSNKTALVDIDFLGWVKDFLDWLQDRCDKEGAKRTEMYKAVSKAFFETYNVVQHHKADTDVKKSTREQLAKYWQDAALAVREYDQIMYEACFEKTKYWLNPGNWTEEQLEATGIKLAAIEPRLKQLGLL